MSNTTAPIRLGITLVEVVVLLAITALLTVLLLVVVDTGWHRPHHHRFFSSNLRSIHQAMFTYAQSNKTGGSDGYFPGLNEMGQVVTLGSPAAETVLDIGATAEGADGTDPSIRLAILIDDGYITPALLINPYDEHVKEWLWPFSAGDPKAEPLSEKHYSLAMLSLTGSDNEKAEWMETASNDAIVLSDRAIGTGPADISSVLTNPGSGRWEGSFTRNDGSTTTEINPTNITTRYANGSVNIDDQLFIDEPDADDAYLVYQDATTAFSPR